MAARRNTKHTIYTRASQHQRYNHQRENYSLITKKKNLLNARHRSKYDTEEHATKRRTTTLSIKSDNASTFLHHPQPQQIARKIKRSLLQTIDIYI